MQCDHIQSRIAFYLDDELREQERVEVEDHLQSCACCRGLCEAERQFLAGIRQAAPLHTAPPQLRQRVADMLGDAPALQSASPALRRSVRRLLMPTAPFSSGLRQHRRVLALTFTIGIFAIATIWYALARRESLPLPRPSEFALMAVDTHLRHLRGQLPLEIVSDSAAEISAWFVGKVAFAMKLPNYQEASGQEKLYRLEGARLVGFRNDYAAYVAYQMRQRPITLVITSNSVALPAGGEEIISKGLRFHYDSINGLKVITWADRGLTYALVSDLEEHGQQSCLVCHAGAKDQDFIEGLRPAR
jgi:anti-sigma factor RsiW